MIFQDPYASLNPRMTVGEIIKEPMKIFNIYDTDEEREARVRELLDIVSLKPDHIRRYPAEFSGGQRQRGAICRALINNPHIIVADEPTGNLDSVNSSELLQLLQKMNKENGVTIVMVTHDPLIASFTTRLVYIKDGNIETVLDKGDMNQDEYFNQIVELNSRESREILAK